MVGARCILTGEREKGMIGCLNFFPWGAGGWVELN